MFCHMFNIIYRILAKGHIGEPLIERQLFVIRGLSQIYLHLWYLHTTGLTNLIHTHVSKYYQEFIILEVEL